MSEFDLGQAITRMAILAVPLLLGIICHELAHGYVAYRLGDPTAKNAGRLNFNPIKHLDPMGSAVFILTAIMPGGFVIGWAKPVPIDPRYFKNPRSGIFKVSLAGPATNFILAFVFGLITKGLYMIFVSAEADLSFLHPLLAMAFAGIFINIILCVFNLLPVPPLDGSKILLSILPRDLAMKYLQVERYGMLILILLLATGVLGYIIQPVLALMLSLVTTVLGLPPELFM